MEHQLLLPSRYKTIGFILLLPSLALGIMVRFFDIQFSWLRGPFQKSDNIFDNTDINFTDEFALTGLVLALLFIAFAKEKNEDEFIAHTRLTSLKWAVLINYILLIAATWLVHGFGFIDVMMYNMLTILIIFIIRFHYILSRNKKTFDEKPMP